MLYEVITRDRPAIHSPDLGVGRGVVGEWEARRQAAEALAFVGLDERADEPVSRNNFV